MSLNNPSDYALHATITKERAAGLRLPEVVLDHFDEVDRLTAELKAATAERPMLAAIDAARAGKLTAKVLAEVTAVEVRCNVLSAALDAAKMDFGPTVRGAREEIIDEVRRSIFDPALANLEALAERVNADATVENLVRAGHAEDATALVSAEADAAAIKRAHTFAAMLDSGRTTKNLAHVFRRFDLARPVVNHGNIWSVPSLLAAIKAGAGLWLPTAAELRGVVASVEKDGAAAKDATRAHYGDAPAWFNPLA